jgi:hypothetical protein
MFPDDQQKIQWMIKKREDEVRARDLLHSLLCRQLLVVVSHLAAKESDKAEHVLSNIVVDIIEDILMSYYGGHELGMALIKRIEEIGNTDLKIFSLMQERLKVVEARLAEREKRHEKQEGGV